MNIDKHEICRICLEKSFGDMNILGSLTTKMLEILPVQMNTSLSPNPVICSVCSKNLQKSFDFKTTCLFQDDYLKTFTYGVTKVVNLQEVVKNENTCNDVVKKEEEKVCRFCLKYYTMESLTSLNNSEDWFMKDMLDRCFPEINLGISTDPVACNKCMESLQHQFNFIALCFDSEQLILNYMSFENIPHDQEINLCDVIDYTKRTKCDFENSIYFIKQEEKTEEAFEESEPDDEFFEETGSKGCKEENRIHIKTESVYKGCGFSPRLGPTNQSTADFTCSHCPYKTNRHDSLISHLLVHNNANNVETHKCDICSFESKWRTSLRTHLLLHKKSTEITLYRCNDCNYQSKYKKHLRRHMKTHKNTMIFSCEFCKCRSKYPEYINNHKCKQDRIKQEVKIEQEEIKIEAEDHTPDGCFPFTKIIEPMKQCWWYKCNFCIYETKKSYHMKEHVVKHLKEDEVELHKCSLCNFKTKYKASLSHHKKQVHQKKGVVA